ncbi:MAG: ParB/RepB/Spo0J family partition protein [Thermoanaerobaculia bacterium]|nr:MAG: ParB/RepB/Spo0J family partition protein [Thermoanaerobaculia bacterium]MBZ0103442.1 ParB/RepB/Spo0J family partition protein [Thermoanaerobaculia bacterium]
MSKAATAAEVEIRELPLDRIHPDERQARTRIGKETISDDEANRVDDLAKSLAALGLQTPILVIAHPESEGHYQIVSGERRFRAATRLGWKSIRAIVSEQFERDLFARMAWNLAENTARRGLDFYDVARHCRKALALHPERTQRQLAEQIGISESRVSKLLALHPVPRQGVDPDSKEDGTRFMRSAFERRLFETFEAALTFSRLKPEQQSRILRNFDRSLAAWREARKSGTALDAPEPRYLSPQGLARAENSAAKRAPGSRVGPANLGAHVTLGRVPVRLATVLFEQLGIPSPDEPKDFEPALTAELERLAAQDPERA